MSLRALHIAVGVEPRPILDKEGRERADAFFVFGVLVRVVSRLRAAFAVLFGRPIGIVIGNGSRAPVVVLDWETYMRMVIGLRPEQLADIGMGDVQELARADHGANDNGG